MCLTATYINAGLVLEQCMYGLLADTDGSLLAESDWAGREIIDITRAVQCCVEQGRLVLWEGSKAALPGVWDPAPADPDKEIVRIIVTQTLIRVVKHYNSWLRQVCTACV